jgi:hypothetical protein
VALIRGMASLEGYNLVVLHYFSASKIWPDKMSGILWEGHYKRGSTVLIFTMITVNGNINTVLNFSKIVFLWMNLKKPHLLYM